MLKVRNIPFVVVVADVTAVEAAAAVDAERVGTDGVKRWGGRFYTPQEWGNGSVAWENSTCFYVHLYNKDC